MTIDMDNAAFQDVHPFYEIFGILSRQAKWFSDAVYDGYDASTMERTVRDYNGNKVGTIKIEQEL
jgi:hypothetical protein